MWNRLGLGAAFLVAIAAPKALHVVSAAPEAKPALPAPSAKTATFVPTCKAVEVVDTRPDPAWIGASFAHDNCWAPRMPAPINGYTATRDQITAGMGAAKNYAASSDAYQRCISDFVMARKAQAERTAKPLDAALITIENHRIAASQTNRQKADSLMKVAINAFNEYGSECPE